MKCSKFLFFGLILLLMSCAKEEPIKTCGCNMKDASNFDRNAFWNDGSCVFDAEVAFCWYQGYSNYYKSLGIDFIKIYINDNYITTYNMSLWCPISACNVPHKETWSRAFFNYNLGSNFQDTISVKVTTLTDSLIIEKTRTIKAGCNSLPILNP